MTADGELGDRPVPRAGIPLAIGRPLQHLAFWTHCHPLVAISLVCLFLALQISPWLYGTEDGSLYLSVARSVARGPHITAFGSPSLTVLPGYPLLIAPLFAISSRPFLWVSIEHWMLATLGVIGIYRWARRVCPEAATLITALAVLNATFTYYYRRPLKEVAYMTLLIWLVNVLQPLLTPRPMRTTAWLLLLVNVLLPLLTIVRYAAIILLPVFGLAMCYQAWRQRVTWRRAILVTGAIGAPACLAALAFMRHEDVVRRPKQAGTYVQTFLTALSDPNMHAGREPDVADHASLGSRYLTGLRLKLREMWRGLIPGMFKDGRDTSILALLAIPLHLACTVVIGIGWWRLLRRQVDLLAIAFPAQTLLYLPLACDQGTRPIMPFLPVLMACLWLAMQGRVWRDKAMGTFLALHLCVALGYWVGFDAPRARDAHRKWTELEQIAGSIGEKRNRVAMDERDPARFELEFLLDRFVCPLAAANCDAFSSGRFDWLVMPVSPRDDPQGVERLRIGSYVLLHRRDGAIVSSLREDTAGSRR